MQAGQVSVWVPIIVGVIGLVGVISGQLINAWREDRRWNRELAREELRWKRELEREKTARSEANKAHWRHEKYELLSELLTFIKKWHNLIATNAALAFSGSQSSNDMREALQQAMLDHVDYQDRVDVLSTDVGAHQNISQALKTYVSYTRYLIEGTFTEKAEVIGPDEFFTEFQGTISEVIKAIRKDLGIISDQPPFFLSRPD